MEVERSLKYDEQSLREELKHIHYKLFGRYPSMKFEEYYLKLNKMKFPALSWQEKNFLLKVVKLKLPLDPVELVSRRKFSIFSKKINSVLYIAESFGEYDSYFQASKSSRIWTIFKLISLALKIPLSFFYGLFLVKLHGL